MKRIYGRYTNKKEKGITTIELVITIIVLLILAGIVLYFMTKSNILEEYEVVGIIDNKIKEPTKYNSTNIDMFNPTDIEDGCEKIFLMSMFFY